MTQRLIPAVFMRGGSSKGVFFHARDVPGERSVLDPILLDVLGSPDPNGRQLDGLGGGISSLSKAVIIGPPSRPDADVDYTFAQVSVDKPVVDWSANCGNLSSAVGPFAVDEGLVQVAEGEALVRIHQVNTRKIIHARFPVAGGKAVVDGDFAIAGVAGTGARIRLDFLSPGGSATRDVLPTGNVVDRLEISGDRPLEASLVDASNPVAFLDARALGLDGSELPDEIEQRDGLMLRIDRIRRAAGVAMDLGATPSQIGLASPKIAWVASPRALRTLDGSGLTQASHDIAVRMVSMERVHRAVPLTGAMCLGVACRIAGTLPASLAGQPARADEVRIAQPSGVTTVGAEVTRGSDGRWHAQSAVVYRTARRLMQGAVVTRVR